MSLFYSYGRFISFILLVLSLSVAAETDPTESQNPGLIIIEQDRYGEILVTPDVDWTIYSKVWLETATVAFRENWARDLRQRNGTIIREKDVERIKSDMSKLLDDVLSRELFVKDGYTMTGEAGVDVMLVTPRIVDLDIYAPDRVRDYIGYALADSQGRMTLELEFHDSVSGELLATSWQYREDPQKGYMEQANSATNRRAFRMMLLRWASWLHDWLTEARTGAPE